MIGSFGNKKANLWPLHQKGRWLASVSVGSGKMLVNLSRIDVSTAQVEESE
jgi:hypothetical protein